jgi:hypothetical protein
MTNIQTQGASHPWKGVTAHYGVTGQGSVYQAELSTP